MERHPAAFPAPSRRRRWFAASCALLIACASVVVLAWPRQTLDAIYELDERRWLDWPVRAVTVGLCLVVGARWTRRRRRGRS